MTVGQLERAMQDDPQELAEWYAEDLTRAADRDEYAREQKRLVDMTPAERIADALKQEAEQGLDELTRKRRR